MPYLFYRFFDFIDSAGDRFSDTFWAIVRVVSIVAAVTWCGLMLYAVAAPIMATMTKEQAALVVFAFLMGGGIQNLPSLRRKGD